MYHTWLKSNSYEKHEKGLYQCITLYAVQYWTYHNMLLWKALCSSNMPLWKTLCMSRCFPKSLFAFQSNYPSCRLPCCANGFIGISWDALPILTAAQPESVIALKLSLCLIKSLLGHFIYSITLYEVRTILLLPMYPNMRL